MQHTLPVDGLCTSGKGWVQVGGCCLGWVGAWLEGDVQWRYRQVAAVPPGAASAM